MITPCLPMLDTASPPFYSDDHVFEVKWDGVRALAGVSGEHWRLWGRGLAEYTDRYPELAVLRRLPPGTVVDGELVEDIGLERGEQAVLLRFRAAAVSFFQYDGREIHCAGTWIQARQRARGAAGWLRAVFVSAHLTMSCDVH